MDSFCIGGRDVLGDHVEWTGKNLADPELNLAHALDCSGSFYISLYNAGQFWYIIF